MRVTAAILILCYSLLACTKQVNEISVNNDSEHPSVKLISPQQVAVVRAGDILTVKTLMTDNRSVAEATWEVMNASTVCGNSPYQGVFTPQEQSFEMKIDFLVPPNFIGNRLVRFTATDNSGNSTSLDVYFTIAN